MNWQQTYRGQSFYVGWMRGVLIYDNSLSPNIRASCLDIYLFVTCEWDVITCNMALTPPITYNESHLHTYQEPWLWKSKGLWKSSKGFQWNHTSYVWMIMQLFFDACKVARLYLVISINRTPTIWVLFSQFMPQKVNALLRTDNKRTCVIGLCAQNMLHSHSKLNKQHYWGTYVTFLWFTRSGLW